MYITNGKTFFTVISFASIRDFFIKISYKFNVLEEKLSLNFVLKIIIPESVETLYGYCAKKYVKSLS